jgi:hypothetical protein
VNFWGAVYPTYYALPYLKASHGNIIVNSSVAGQVPTARMSFYNVREHRPKNLLQLDCTICPFENYNAPAPCHYYVNGFLEGKKTRSAFQKKLFFSYLPCWNILHGT